MGSKELSVQVKQAIHKGAQVFHGDLELNGTLNVGKLFATKEYIEGLLLENCGHINKPGTNRKPEQESTGDEPLDDLYSALAEVLNSEETTPSGITVTLQENSAIISEGTTGLVTWDAALILAEWAFENVDLFKNRTILEFGSGIGLTGLAICKGCFPKRYTFSDFHQKVLQQLRENIQLNGFVLGAEQDKLVKTEIVKDLDTPQLLVKNLDWESITEEHLSQLESDVVIASDVVYDPEIVSSFTNVLHTILQKNDEKGPDIFVASTIRNLETHALFQAKLEDAGLKWQILADQKKSMFASETSCTVQIVKISLKC